MSRFTLAVRAGLGTCAMLIATLALPVGAQAATANLTWGAPTALDTIVGSSLPSVSCPSASECVAGEQFGQVVVFDPARTPRPPPWRSIRATRSTR